MALIPYLDPAEAQRMIHDVLIYPWKAEAWVALTPHLEPAEAARVIDEEITDAVDRAWARMALVPHLDGPAATLTELERVIRELPGYYQLGATAWRAPAIPSRLGRLLAARGLAEVCRVSLKKR